MAQITIKNAVDRVILVLRLVKAIWSVGTPILLENCLKYIFELNWPCSQVRVVEREIRIRVLRYFDRILEATLYSDDVLGDLVLAEVYSFRLVIFVQKLRGSLCRFVLLPDDSDLI